MLLRGKMRIQLVTDEPEAFRGFLARRGHFVGVRNYIAFVGQKDDTLDERTGYYGERLVLLAQQLGLNTCWVAATYRKKNAPPSSIPARSWSVSSPSATVSGAESPTSAALPQSCPT